MTVLPDADVLETALGEAERREESAQRRRGLLLALPSFAYMILFFAVPLLIVLVYSFSTRTSTGSTSLFAIATTPRMTVVRSNRSSRARSL